MAKSCRRRSNGYGAVVKEPAKNAWTKNRVVEVALMIAVQITSMAVFIKALHLDVIVSAFLAAVLAILVALLYQRAQRRKDVQGA